MIEIFVLNGSEYMLNLFNNFKIHSYKCKFTVPVMFIYKDKKMIHKIFNFDKEYLYNIWLNLS